MAVNTGTTAQKGGWTPPPPGIFKVNVDGATFEDGRNSSMGATIRDSCGANIAASCKYLQGQFSVVEVEAIAVENGILLARDMKILQVILESDVESIVTA